MAVSIALGLGRRTGAGLYLLSGSAVVLILIVAGLRSHTF